MNRTGNEVVESATELFDFPVVSSPGRLRAIAELTRESETGMDFVVQGACMEPLLHVGDRVRVEARRFYLPGDVLAFVERETVTGQKVERLLVHRLLGYDRRQGRLNYVTGADAARGFDPPFARERILGRVVTVSRQATGGEDCPPPSPLRIGLAARCRAMLRFTRLAVPAFLRRLRRIAR